MEISPVELNGRIKNRESIFLLDVRTKEEYENNKINNAKLIPIQILDSKLNQIPQNKLIITICAHGNRSLRAAKFLNFHGYKALSLRGGMEAWNIFIKKI